MDVPCLKVVISKGIGYGMIVFSSILKLPQIIKIMSAKSVEGLSPASFYMEVLAFTFTIVYNYILKYPFSSYGEAVVINVQNILLVFLLWAYSDKKTKPSMVTQISLIATYLALIGGMFYLPKEYLSILPAVSTVSAMVGRIPQIILNYKNKHTGQV